MNNKEKYWLTKVAKGMKTYELSGEVQGVGLRKAVHQRLDQLKSEGMAVNNARNNNVYMTIPEDVSEDLLETVKLHVAERARERNTEYPEPKSREVKRDKMRRVKLRPEQVRAFAKGQGLAQLAEKEDAAIAQWLAARYRLNEEGGNWVGRVPSLARKQIYAEEPIYQGQLNDPDDWGEFAWDKKAEPLLTRDDIVSSMEALAHPGVGISGGAAMVLHGLRDTTSDIDADAPTDVFEEIHAKYGSPTIETSEMGTRMFTIPGTPIDLHEGQSPGEEMEGVIGTVESPEQLLKFYERLNRPKDQQSLKVLRAYGQRM